MSERRYQKGCNPPKQDHGGFARDVINIYTGRIVARFWAETAEESERMADVFVSAQDDIGDSAAEFTPADDRQ